MKVILLRGQKDSGKSSTLMLLIKQLIDDGYDVIMRNEVGGLEYDVSILLKKNGEEFTVMIHCAADDQGRIEELERFLKYTQNVDVLVAACRKKGSEWERMNKLFGESGKYQVESLDKKDQDNLFDKVADIQKKIEQYESNGKHNN